MSTVAVQRSKTYDIVYIAVFAVIMAICSWISIPAAVPFTLQTFGVFIAVGVLGGKRGSLSVLVFILLGAIGILCLLTFQEVSESWQDLPVDTLLDFYFPLCSCGQWRNFREKNQSCRLFP